jgi:DNA repair photolyase
MIGADSNADERVFYTAPVRTPYREEPCRTALNRVRGMPFRWSLNPYTGCVHRCTFCYVRGFEQRADRPSGDGYGRSIRVKVNIAEVLRREVSRRSWQRQEVAIGAATDPYQPAEGRYRLTRACIVELARSGTPFSLITRGPLVVRDVDVLVDAAQQVEVGVCLSIPTLDERVWRTTEPGTAPPCSRLRAVSALADAGLDVSVAIAPVLPVLSDRPAQLAEAVRAAKEAGARRVWSKPLDLRPGTREHFLAELARDWPEALEDYERLYAERAYLPRSTARELAELVRSHTRAQGVGWQRRRPPVRPTAPAQLTLAV